MTGLATAAFHLFLQASAQAPDTVWVQAAPVAQNWFQKLVGVASGITTLAILASAVVIVPAMWRFSKTYKRTTQLLDKIQADVAPLVKHAHSIADNVDYITTAIRADVAKIQGTLNDANLRLQDAIASTEQRVNEFNALLAVVQSEAEGAFVTTAATVRGVREGVAEFARGSGPEIASDEPDDGSLDAAIEDELENDEYGYLDSAESDDRADPARTPRIIRRARTRE